MQNGQSNEKMTEDRQGAGGLKESSAPAIWSRPPVKNLKSNTGITIATIIPLASALRHFGLCSPPTIS